MTSPYPLFIASRGLVGTSDHNWMQPHEPSPRDVLSIVALQRVVDETNAKLAGRAA